MKQEAMNTAGLGSRLTTHPMTSNDAVAMAALRDQVTPNKGRMQGIEARPIFDDIMTHVSAPAGVSYRSDTISGVPGWWAQPADATQGRVLLHIHGGAFNWGTATAFRHLVGHIAARTKTNAFIPDYRLAPEHPFPAALDDVQAVYDGLAAGNIRRIVITGDSAGGNLMLSLLATLARRASDKTVQPLGAVALSPMTDLTLSGASWESRAATDPYFTKAQVAGLVRSYLAGHDATDPLVSPLYANLAGLPPIRIHAGDDEMLLDDSTRYVARAVAAGVDAALDVWTGMPHVFMSGVGHLSAADQALDLIGAFLTERLESKV